MLTEPKFIVWHLWSIFFGHHLPLKPSIGKRRKQSCTPNTIVDVLLLDVKNPYCLNTLSNQSSIANFELRAMSIFMSISRSVLTIRWRELATVDRIASTHTARGKQEPVHEYTLTVIIRIVCEQPVPLILLLASAVTTASIRLCFSTKKKIQFTQCFYCVRNRIWIYTSI